MVMFYKNKKIFFDGEIVSLYIDNDIINTSENEICWKNESGKYTLSSSIMPKFGGGVNAQKISHKFIPDTPLDLDIFALSFEFLSDKKELWEEAKSSFHWIPNIKSEPCHVAGEHTFRSPAVIISTGQYAAALIPDISELTATEPEARGHFLDLRFPQDSDTQPPVFAYGIGSNSPNKHVYYKLNGKKYHIDEKGIFFSFYLFTFHDYSTAKILRFCTKFMWDTFAGKYETDILPQTVPFNKYAEYGYNMAFKHLWQEGHVDNTGGICLVTFKRDDGVLRGREYADDLWFHAWFNNMRTAMGIAAFGYREQAEKIARLLISAPQKCGAFPTIYAPHNENIWVCSSHYHGGGTNLYSLPDCSWAALWLRRFITEYGSINGAETFLENFADFLLSQQNHSGGFPCWVFADSLKNDERLNDSASSALPAWFLGEELLANGNHIKPEKYQEIKKAVIKAADFIVENIIKSHKFEDFELYYSCSWKPLDFYDNITRMYGENTLAIQWCAECLRVAYILSGDEKYLENGLVCISLLCLYQQVWDNPRLDFYTFGGFGVMNTDGEWNDARQAQFAETLMNYYDLTGDFEFLKRAVASARASFALMIIDENKEVCPRNYKGEDTNSLRHGGSAENYGHGGNNERSGQSGFHWGVGSALTTAAVIKKKYSDLLIDLKCGQAVGTDGIAVTSCECGKDYADIKILSLSEINDFDIKVIFKTAEQGNNNFKINIEGFYVYQNNNNAKNLFTAKKTH
jgi:hypothetical protein